MSHPLNAYKKQMSVAWTRIEMLLALYNGAISQLNRAIESLAQGDTDAATQNRLKASRIVMEILGGVDMQYGELPANIVRLCTFVISEIGKQDRESLRSAISVLETLRQGFEDIKQEAIALEGEGKIPAIDVNRRLDATVA